MKNKLSKKQASKKIALLIRDFFTGGKPYEIKLEITRKIELGNLMEDLDLGELGKFEHNLFDKKFWNAKWMSILSKSIDEWFEDSIHENDKIKSIEIEKI